MRRLVPALVMATLLAAPCRVDAQAGGEMAAIQDYLDSLPPLTLVQANPGVLGPIPDLPRGIAGRQRAGGRFVNQAAELTILRLFSDVMWPGALVQGGSIANNKFAPIYLPRAGGRVRLATNFVGGGSDPKYRDLPLVGAGEVDKAIQDMLREIKATDSAGLLQMDQAFAGTAQEAFVKLGVAYQGSFTGSASGKFNKNYDQNTLFVKFTQVFYTVSFDLDATLPSPFLAPGTTLAAVERFASARNPPLYVSEVKYGRVLLMSFTSSLSKTDIEATAHAAYKGFTGDLEARYKDKLDAMSIAVLSVGETGDVAATPVVARTTTEAFDRLRAYVTAGSRYGATNPGGPIAFTMRYVGSRDGLGGPYQPAIAQMVTDESPEVVSLEAREYCGERRYLVFDGVDERGRRGGWTSTELTANPGDKVRFFARGTNWSGVLFTGDYGPRGWHTWDRPKDGERGFPITNRSPFALIGRFGAQNKEGRDITGGSDQYSMGTQADVSSSFFIGDSAEIVAGGDASSGQYPNYGPIWLGLNDNVPDNGDAAKKFEVTVCITPALR